MEPFEIAAVLLTLAALLSYVNHRFIRLPTTIGLMVQALVLSLLIILAGGRYREHADAFLQSVDFNEALMHGMLGFLLFAGALHVDLGDLMQQKRIIAVLATAGVVATTFIVGAMTWLLTNLMGLDVKFIHCLLFGALISPTDPIAVLGLLKKLGAPRSLAAKIAGESLFNDGVGVVVFLVLMNIAGLGSGHGPVTAGSVTLEFAREALGGALFGFGIGFVAYRMLRSVDNYQVEVLISLALVTGGYALAMHLHLSGPIAMVVAGLLIGNHGRSFAMSDKSREHLDMFWELVDEILNAVLFVLIGLEVLVLSLTGQYLLAGLAAIAMTLLARFLAVGAGVMCLRPLREFTPHAVKVMTWGGLRGGISVALALWLSQELGGEHQTTRQVILVMTYVVVIFSIVVQGLTISPLMRRWQITADPRNSPRTSPQTDPRTDPRSNHD